MGERSSLPNSNSPLWTRREWLLGASAFAASCATRANPREDALVDGSAALDGPSPDGPSAQEGSVPDAAPIAALDDAMRAFMTDRGVPGGALAVLRRGQLLYARGYGVTEQGGSALVAPTSRFRIASLSKAFTAVAVLQQVEAGRLSLEEPFLRRLNAAPWLAPGASVDPRVATITVRQLLQHTGGWDRGLSPDPMFRARQVASALGVASPPSRADVLRYVLGLPLEHDPGTVFAYANVGYFLLGRLLEQVSGSGYAELLAARVLGPCGIRAMTQGRTLRALRGPDEVGYAMPQGASDAPSVFDEQPGNVPWPYGGWCLENMDSHGGWVGTVVDLARWCAALEDPSRSPVLQRASFDALYARPPAPAWRNADGSLTDYYYGAGWLVRPVTGGANYWHDGSLDGTASYLVRRADGFAWATLFNQRSADPALPDSAIDGALNTALGAVRSWPTTDLFARYA